MLPALTTVDLLLINPPAYAYGFERLPLTDFDGILEAVPPLGLCYCAAVVRNAGFSVAILDMEAGRLSPLHLRSCLEASRPKVVGITMTTPQRRVALELATIVKKWNSRVNVVVGGPHPTIIPRDLHDREQIDFIVSGDGEPALPPLLETTLRNNGRLTEVPNISFRNESGCWVSNDEAIVGDLDDLPVPARDLLENDLYYNALSTANPTTGMIVSRGCPFTCLFCRPLFRSIRRRSVSAVIAELLEINRMFGITSVDFFDETFNLDTQWIRNFCRELSKQTVKFVWRARCRPDFIDETTVADMVGAGCSTISLGIESLSENGLRYLRKGYTTADIENAVRVVTAVCHCHGYFILGIPTEKREDIRSTVAFPCQHKLTHASFYLLNPLPGTPLADQLNADNSLRDIDPDDLRGFRLPLVPHPTISPRALRRFRLMALVRFYCRPRILGSVVKSLLQLYRSSPGFRKALYSMVFTNSEHTPPHL